MSAGRFQRLKIRYKLVGGVSVFLLLVGIFIFVFFPQREAAQMEKSLNGKAEALAQIAANGTSSAMLYDDAASVKSVVEGSQSVQEVVFALAIRANGSKLVAIRDENSIALSALINDNLKHDRPVVIETDELSVAFAPVLSGGTRIGTIVMGLDKGLVHSFIAGNRWIALLVSVLIVGLGIVSLSWLINEVVVRPVQQISTAMDNADLNFQFTSANGDEIGDLQRSFDKFVTSIKETLIQVSESASAVASASSEISSSTEQMAASAQEQTSQAAEVASAVEEMTKTIVENSKNASNTADTAKDAKKAAEQGGAVVEETVGGMKRIAEVVKQSAGTVQELGRSSDQIGEIIGVIDDIADQTNLLALNAAIEAARAGEQGRGFAVVADEVRKLAERTTKATKEIAGMIKKIQADTKGAVISMEEGTKQVDDGIKLADKAGASLHEIVGISQKVTDMVSQIAAASEQQSSASEQISKNVEAISSVTNESAAGVQQIARAAEDLNRLTENLQQLLTRFNLGGEATGNQVRQASTPSNGSFKMPKSNVAVRANGKLVHRNQNLQT